MGIFWLFSKSSKSPCEKVKIDFPYSSYLTKTSWVGKILGPKPRQFCESSRRSFWTNTSSFFENGQKTLKFEFGMTSSAVTFGSLQNCAIFLKSNDLGMSCETFIQFSQDLRTGLLFQDFSSGCFMTIFFLNNHIYRSD